MANEIEKRVVAGVLVSPAGQVLITQRPPGKMLAGAWEFPGGKLDTGEDRLAGLGRELLEELGISIESARPLIRYRHQYDDFSVDLDTWKVTGWRGEPRGLEGQALAWELPQHLLQKGLLPADETIVCAIRLPDEIAVTPPGSDGNEEAFLDRLESRSEGLVCLRRPDLDVDRLLEVAAGAACRVEGGEGEGELLLHGDPALLGPLILEPPANLALRLARAVAGLHTPARFLSGLAKRPIPRSLWFGVSCHDEAELHAALEAEADYAFLGPVNATPSHPGAPGLGWDKFSALIKDLPLPVYAIGGVGPEDLETAWAAGAQGIAGISAFWPK